jgi:hypothetical protein
MTNVESIDVINHFSDTDWVVTHQFVGGSSYQSRRIIGRCDMIKLRPNERLVVERGVNQYQLVGPGRVWLRPWDKALTTLNIGPQGQALQINEVRTVENVPINVTVQVIYQVDPTLFGDGFLAKLRGLNEGGWQGILQWRTEYVLRQWLADYSWQTLQQQNIQQRLERQLTHTLAESLEKVALKLLAVCLVRTTLPDKLQRTIVQAEQDGVEPRGRALVLREYFDIFGADLAQAMPYIVQWELLNTLHKNGNAQLLLTSTAPPLPDNPDQGQPAPPVFQMKLPIGPSNQAILME